jgi:hypothetical protein
VNNLTTNLKMKQPILKTSIQLSDEQCSKLEVDAYYLAIKSYFKNASENDFSADKDSLKINVENRFLNPPIRDINGRQPSNAEMFPFDLEIRIINNSKLTVEMKVSYFWTIIVYLFFSLLVILYFWISGELLSASKFILPFFLSILTIYIGGMAAVKTNSFKKRLKNIYEKTD